MKLTLIILFTLSHSAWANQQVATVKMLRGEVTVVLADKSKSLKVEDWVEEGAIIKTADKSFVKLIFLDKSSMNVGPNSEMKIEQFSGKEAGVIDVVKGQIRSQVSKDYLQIQDPNKSKLFMKTSNAVMGVRGTDFMITTNGTNTATVLFEGEVVFNSLPERAPNAAPAKLDDIVDRGVRIMPGEFSVVERDRPQPTVPSVMNLQQREVLEKNVNFESASRSPSSTPKEDVKSVVPDGLSGEVVSNSSENLKSEVASVVADSAPAAAPASNGEAAGFVDGDKVKPANGSFVHLESGTVVPPPAGSVLDPDTNTYIPGSGNGSVADDGSYEPPAGVEISANGEMSVTVVTANGEVVKQAIQVPAPTLGSAPTMSSLASIFVKNPEMLDPNKVVAAPTSSTTTTSTSTSPTPIDRTVSGTASQLENQVQRTLTSGRLNIDVIK